jgi:hypothetical protein
MERREGQNGQKEGKKEKTKEGKREDGVKGGKGRRRK